MEESLVLIDSHLVVKNEHCTFVLSPTVQNYICTYTYSTVHKSINIIYIYYDYLYILLI